MATPLEFSGACVETILTKFKLLNVILDQLMDGKVIVDHYRHIAVHKLNQNYIEKLNFGQNCQIHLLLPK